MLQFIEGWFLEQVSQREPTADTSCVTGLPAWTSGPCRFFLFCGGGKAEARQLRGPSASITVQDLDDGLELATTQVNQQPITQVM